MTKSFAAENEVTARLSDSNVYIDGKIADLQGYYIKGNNYYKLRDFAYSLNGTSKQFSVSWDGNSRIVELQSGESYVSDGMKQETINKSSDRATLTNNKIIINKKEVMITAYIINGNTYLKLRDLGEYLSIPVLYQHANQSIQLITNDQVTIKEYSNVVMERNSDDFSYGNSKGISKRYMFQAAGKKYILEDANKDNVLNIYDLSSTQGKPIRVTKELPLFGGFHQDDHHFYVVYGQNNDEESNSKAVYRIVKYNDNWDKVAQVDIKDVHVSQPFRSGNVTIDSSHGKLYVHSTRLRYLAEDGLRHQSNITFAIDMDKMQVIRNGETWPNNHVSHSFATDIKFDGDKIVYVDHGDAYPRAIRLQIEESNQKLQTYDLVHPISGNIGDNYTGLYLGGLEVGHSNYVVLSTYSKLYNQPINSQNVRIDVLSKDLVNNPYADTIWLTNYEANDQVSITQSHLVKIDDHTLVVLWNERRNATKSQTLYYAIISDSGHILQKATELAGIPAPGNMKPLVDARNIMWYFAYNSDPVILFTLQIPTFTSQPIPTNVVVRTPDKIEEAIEQMGYNPKIYDNSNPGYSIHYEITDNENNYLFSYGFFTQLAMRQEGKFGGSSHSYIDSTQLLSHMNIVQEIVETDLNRQIPGLANELLIVAEENVKQIQESNKEYKQILQLNDVKFEVIVYKLIFSDDREFTFVNLDYYLEQ